LPNAAAKDSNPIVSHGNFAAMALVKNVEVTPRKKLLPMLNRKLLDSVAASVQKVLDNLPRI
jgi:hypothetical protein